MGFAMTVPADGQAAKHEKAVRERVQAAQRAGYSELNDVLRQCEGADPVLVAGLLKTATVPIAPRPIGGTRTSESLSALSPRLPAPDPSRSQWWFSSSGISSLLDAVEGRIGLFEEPRIFCLGTPTLAPYLANKAYRLDVFDVDRQVLDVIEPLNSGSGVHHYDASESLPDGLLSSFQIAVLDPPWYPTAVYTFINRAIAALTLDGEILCTVPGRLTRPGIERFRTALIKDLVQNGHEILSTQRDVVQYQVPRFELVALEHLKGFTNIPWRSGDLLHIRKGSDNTLPTEPLEKMTLEVFSRNPTEFRIFTRDTERAVGIAVKELPLYSANISTRAYPDQEADVWSTEKVGVQTNSVKQISTVLKVWSCGLGMEEAKERLTEGGCSADLAADTVTRLERAFNLWSRFAAQPPLRLSDELKRAREASLSCYATQATQREHGEQSDTFRGDFQHDRDRILWSAGLRRLSNKTQLFPVEHDDDLRQRLTHSIEVSQLASTIGTSFGLDGDLIEAGALAHDIGHTPFGHAGEYALDKLISTIGSQLNGFNHYEHGIDVLRYLEGPYYVSPTVQFTGLNLTPELCECVFKHTYCHNKGNLSSETLLARSKHGKLVQRGYSHLEGQAVRIADKIAYLISDLEDGIRLGAVSQSDLLKCRFFHRPPLDFHSTAGARLFDRFLEQRRWVLKILMEDVLQASNKRLVRLSGGSPNNVRNAGEYIINHSDEMAQEVDQIWRELQAGRLHKDSRVISANLHAARVVSELAISYSLLPQLIDERFRGEHERLWNTAYIEFYRNQVGRTVTLRKEMISFLPMHLMIGTEYQPGSDAGIPTEQLIMAKDYVAALSDTRARQLHRELTEGRRQS
jgi:dGTPase